MDPCGTYRSVPEKELCHLPFRCRNAQVVVRPIRTPAALSVFVSSQLAQRLRVPAVTYTYRYLHVGTTRSSTCRDLRTVAISTTAGNSNSSDSSVPGTARSRVSRVIRLAMKFLTLLHFRLSTLLSLHTSSTPLANCKKAYFSTLST